MFLGRVDEAKEVFSKAVERDPTNPRALALLQNPQIVQRSLPPPDVLKPVELSQEPLSTVPPSALQPTAKPSQSSETTTQHTSVPQIDLESLWRHTERQGGDDCRPLGALAGSRVHLTEVTVDGGEEAMFGFLSSPLFLDDVFEHKPMVLHSPSNVLMSALSLSEVCNDGASRDLLLPFLISSLFLFAISRFVITTHLLSHTLVCLSLILSPYFSLLISPLCR